MTDGLGITAAKGFALGLSTGVYCLASCAPVLLPYLASGAVEGMRAAAGAVVRFTAGRLAAYSLVAAAGCVAGARVIHLPGVRIVAALAMMALAMVMVAFGVTRNFPHSRACEWLTRRDAVRRYPVLAGALVGMRACPPLLLCVTTLMTSGGGAASLAFVLSFFAGTVVLSAPLALGARLSSMGWVRGVAEGAFVFCGLWFAVSGIALLM